MLMVTSHILQDRRIITYHGVVTGEAILGMNLFRDLFARVRDIFGGRAGSYEDGIRRGRVMAMEDMMAKAQAIGANAIIAIDLDYTIHGQGILFVMASGTAVTVVGEPAADDDPG